MGNVALLFKTPKGENEVYPLPVDARKEKEITVQGLLYVLPEQHY